MNEANASKIIRVTFIAVFMQWEKKACDLVIKGSG